MSWKRNHLQRGSQGVGKPQVLAWHQRGSPSFLKEWGEGSVKPWERELLQRSRNLQKRKGTEGINSSSSSLLSLWSMRSSSPAHQRLKTISSPWTWESTDSVYTSVSWCGPQTEYRSVEISSIRSNINRRYPAPSERKIPI